MKYIKLIVLLIATLTINSIAFTQTSSDSLKCFTYNQLKEITKSLKKARLCDSISQNQALQILHYKSVVNKDFEIIALNEAKINKQAKSIKVLGIKLNISKRLTFLGVPVAAIGGFLVGSVLSK